MKFELSADDTQWLTELRCKLETKLRAECGRMGNKIPYILNRSNEYEDIDNIFWWTNGFWAGMMWQMYHATGEDLFLEAARVSGERISRTLEEPEKLDHDVGFMFLHTSVADYRLTDNVIAKERAMRAVSILASRYNEQGGYIQAWNNNLGVIQADRMYIVDCLMNLPLLYWGTRESGNSRFSDIAASHADKTLMCTLRGDGSSNHIIECDPQTGQVISAPAGQGFCENSSWSRGQSWVIYGMALSAKYTGNSKYLTAAKNAAHYFLACTSMTDYIPSADFRAPEEPKIYDVTAGLCAACGMLEIAGQVDDIEKSLYIEGALRLLRAADKHCCSWNPDKDGITFNGSVSYNSQKNIHIIYGDYFLTEAVLRLTGENFMIW